MPGIRVGIIGVGNCAAGLIQGVDLQREGKPGTKKASFPKIGGCGVEDIQFVSAFDVGSNKIGKPLGKAIYEFPNMVKWKDFVTGCNVEVMESPVLDGVSELVDKKVRPVRSTASLEKLRDSILRELERTRTELIVNYLPVGSQKATEFWADVALEAGCGMVNCIPVFIASDEKWGRRFAIKNLPIIGDDVKGVVGATIVHRTLAQLCSDRGVDVGKTYQINVGGNTDFLNLKELKRLQYKKISKTEAVQNVLAERLPEDQIHVGPSDFIPYLGNTKVAFIRIEGTMFPGIPFNMETRLEVDDKANSAGIVVDAIRYCKVALEKGRGGPLVEASAWLMKHPPKQMSDAVARNMTNEWLEEASIVAK
ncbi:MAG: inositol-3-phosphate synthase [Nitrososphaerota archaeon]|nr:inositol-3-phosphate synthase [Nitrososphaerota archaeon]